MPALDQPSVVIASPRCPVVVGAKASEKQAHPCQTPGRPFFRRLTLAAQAALQAFHAIVFHFGRSCVDRRIQLKPLEVTTLTPTRTW
jgi:hypothetical protein